MSKKKNAKNNLVDQSVYDDYKNAIPEDEIWTYQIEGLQAPHVNKAFTNFKIKRIIVVAVLIVAISTSIFLSVRAVHADTFQYEALSDGTYEFVKFSNPGDVLNLTVDYAENDVTKPISVLHEYVFNCDEKIQTVTLGKDIKEIDGKSFYSCYALKAIYVDEDNEYFCDVDGVLYNKDKTELICYPIDHDLYLREKYGYDRQYWPEDPEYDEEYVEKINTYVVPETVKTIGKLAFNYSELFRVYLPEGLETLETMAFFRNWHMENIYTYEGDETYDSLPSTLTYIGSDAFNSNQQLKYMYIPESVTYIGHHAFWNCVYKEGGELKGVTEINVALDERAFKSQTHTGDQWRGEFDNGLFPKAVPVNYGAQRK